MLRRYLALLRVMVRDFYILDLLPLGRDTICLVYPSLRDAFFSDTIMDKSHVYQAHPGPAQIIHNEFHGGAQDEALGVDEATGDCIGVSTDFIRKNCSIKAP